jgi:hypothetical protein
VIQGFDGIMVGRFVRLNFQKLFSILKFLNEFLKKEKLTSVCSLVENRVFCSDLSGAVPSAFETQTNVSLVPVQTGRTLKSFSPSSQRGL